MAKSSGLGDYLYLQGVDVSGDVGSLSKIGGGPAVLDVTGINASAVERVAGRRTGEINFNAWFNSTGSHTTFDNLPTTQVGVSYFDGGVLGNPCATLYGYQVNYDPTFGNDGSLVFGVQALSSGAVNALEWGVQLTAGQRTDTTGTNPATGVDDLAGSPSSTDFGATIWVHLLAFTGTSVTFTLRDSANNSAFSAVTGGAATAMSAVGYQRWVTSSTQNIRRYLAIGTSGTFSNAVFVCGVTRHLTASL